MTTQTTCKNSESLTGERRSRMEIKTWEFTVIKNGDKTWTNLVKSQEWRLTVRERQKWNLLESLTRTEIKWWEKNKMKNNFIYSNKFSMTRNTRAEDTRFLEEDISKQKNDFKMFFQILTASCTMQYISAVTISSYTLQYKRSIELILPG